MAAVRIASPAEYPAACRELFAHLPAEERIRPADRVRHLIAAGEIDPGGLLVALTGGRVTGALLIQFQPGASAVVSLPGTTDPVVASELASAAVAQLHRAGVKQAQVLVGAADVPHAEPLEAVGFRHVTQLTFLCRRMPDAEPELASDELDFTPVDGPLATFAATLQATYEGTLDCPELNGLRSIENVLAGYAAKSDAPRWWLVSRGEGPLGVVMLDAGPKPGLVEMSYLGLIPQARGQGLGRELLDFALREAFRSGAEWMTLSADVRNVPAIQLYESHEFRQYDLQHVFIWTPA